MVLTVTAATLIADDAGEEKETVDYIPIFESLIADSICGLTAVDKESIVVCCALCGWLFVFEIYFSMYLTGPPPSRVGDFKHVIPPFQAILTTIGFFKEENANGSITNPYEPDRLQVGLPDSAACAVSSSITWLTTFP